MRSGEIIGAVIITLLIVNRLAFAKELPDSTQKPNFSVFVPGLVQYRNDEKFLAFTIMVSQAVSTGLACFLGYLSESEYNKYKKLPLNTPQAEFDKCIKNSNDYGTQSLVWLTFASGIYLYSVVDAMYYSHPKKTVEYGIYLSPGNAGLSLAVKF